MTPRPSGSPARSAWTAVRSTTSAPRSGRRRRRRRPRRPPRPPSTATTRSSRPVATPAAEPREVEREAVDERRTACAGRRRERVGARRGSGGSTGRRTRTPAACRRPRRRSGRGTPGSTRPGAGAGVLGSTSVTLAVDGGRTGQRTSIRSGSVAARARRRLPVAALRPRSVRPPVEASRAASTCRPSSSGLVASPVSVHVPVGDDVRRCRRSRCSSSRRRSSQRRGAAPAPSGRSSGELEPRAVRAERAAVPTRDRARRPSPSTTSDGGRQALVARRDGLEALDGRERRVEGQRHAARARGDREARASGAARRRARAGPPASPRPVASSRSRTMSAIAAPSIADERAVAQRRCRAAIAASHDRRRRGDARERPQRAAEGPGRDLAPRPRRQPDVRARGARRLVAPGCASTSRRAPTRTSRAPRRG